MLIPVNKWVMSALFQDHVSRLLKGVSMWNKGEILSWSNLIDYLEKEKLPSNGSDARKVAAEVPNFTVIDKILYLLDGRRQNRRRTDYCSGCMAGYFSGKRLYNALCYKW